VEPLLPPLLAGARAAGASLPVGGLRMPAGQLGAAFTALGAPQAGDGPQLARAARSIVDVQDAARVLGGAVHDGKPAAPAPDGALAAQLDLIAELVEAGVPTRVYSASLGGFDTHADEKGTQQRLLTQLDKALAPFVSRMARGERGKQVAVLVYSEFGRRVAANGGDGTDHGTAGPVFLLGSGVRGGFHGAQPSLTDLDNGDLKENVDFRSVYATLLGGVLGTDPARVLGAGYPAPLPQLLA
jgi:uncharacterized protein (DUF1501 family)